MLTLSRKASEVVDLLDLNSNLIASVMVTRIKPTLVQLGFEAGGEVVIRRRELGDREPNTPCDCAPAICDPPIWTDATPNTPGNYWMRRNKHASANIVLVKQGTTMLFVEKYGWSVDRFDGAQWSGPIAQPADTEENQIDGA